MRSGLITPGGDLRKLEKASMADVDYVHIELEDGVAPERKIEARAVTVEALTRFDWSDKLTLVRVNSVTSGFLEDDVNTVAGGRPTAFLLAKCQGPDDIRYLDQLIAVAEAKYGIDPEAIKIASMIERINALQTIDAISQASRRMMALYIGATDLGTEVGYRRTFRGQEPEVAWVRSRVILAAHAAGLLALDSSCVWYRDQEETYEQARWSYHLGFDGKSAMSPRQVDSINRAFTPTEDEVRWAEQVFAGKEEAERSGLSVWVVDGMFVDEAMIGQATSILKATGRRGC
jgi:citrate lyase subunit beta/citryl-CoA lyase